MSCKLKKHKKPVKRPNLSPFQTIKYASATAAVFLGSLLGTTALNNSAYANPEGANIVGGSATIQESGKKLDVHQHTHRTVINWQSFDIDLDEHTEFHQPSSSAIAVNRVKSADPSKILGKLSANGNVVLINPNGVFFGSQAKVDVNGLVATSADIGTNAFMNGSTDFNIAGNPDAEIVNEGTITAAEAGLVGLVAPTVKNSGVIAAKMGRVQLASGDTVAVDFYGDGLLQVAIQDEDVKSQLVENTGKIEAEGGTIAMTAAAARGVIDSLIVAEGEMKAVSVEKKGGKIVIAAAGSNNTSDKTGNSRVIVDGTLDASGTKNQVAGGSIDIFGDQIALMDNAKLDASGSVNALLAPPTPVTKPAQAGGSIRIGGDYQGKGDVQTSKTTFIAEGATIKANAESAEGDAGRIIIWADDLTRYYGHLEAKAENGDGGFAEVSGKKSLLMQGTVDLTSKTGANGTLLLDPQDIIITDSTGTNNADAEDPFGTNSTTDYSITDDHLETLLLSSSVILQASRDIIVNEDVTATTDHSLSLLAARHIDVNASIELNGSGTLALVAGWDTVDTDVANIVLNNAEYGNSDGSINL